MTTIGALFREGLHGKRVMVMVAGFLGRHIVAEPDRPGVKDRNP
jgi:hypothetical protein